MEGDGEGRESGILPTPSGDAALHVDNVPTSLPLRLPHTLTGARARVCACLCGVYTYTRGVATYKQIVIRVILRYKA